VLSRWLFTLHDAAGMDFLMATVTKADREAAWKALNAGLMPVNGELAAFVNRWFDGRETLEGPAAKTLDTIALAIATARSEGIAQGREHERNDTTAWLRSVEGWRPAKLAESIDDECHVGAHEMAGCTAAGGDR
jgi:hypothetical protein